MIRRKICRFPRTVTIFLTLVMFSTQISAHGAQVVPGSPCPKVKKSVVYKGELFTCIKLGKKKYWNSGTMIVKPVLYASVSERDLTKVEFSVSATNRDSCTTSIKKSASVIDSLSVTIKLGKGEGELTIPSSGGLYVLVTECKYSGGDYFALNVEGTPSNSNPSETDSAQPSKSPQPTPSPVTLNLPTASSTYWGKTQLNDCWFAKKVVNGSNSTTVASQQLVTLISTEGTIIENKLFEIPSLRPGQSMWLAAWQLDDYCRGIIGQIQEGKITKREFFLKRTEFQSIETKLSDIPTIISVVPATGKYASTFIYKLKVKNNSATQYLDTNTSSGTKISFVFLDSSGKPIYAFAGRTMSKAPALGEATLTAWDFEIGSISVPTGTASIEPGLIFELCNSSMCNY